MMFAASPWLQFGLALFGGRLLAHEQRLFAALLFISR